MSAEQLCFFRFTRPLLDLLGVEFFRQAPAQPGVYLFLGEADRVLYVGQSKNIRTRLSYYKNAQPEREPRRIIRLVHQTRRIQWQTCETPEEAQAREIRLIQEHRPRFNVQHALSRTYSFFGLQTEGGTVKLRLTLDPAMASGELLIGAFKNRGLCRQAMFALARTAWSWTHSPPSIFALPMCLLDRSKLHEVTWPANHSGSGELRELLRGESPVLIGETERLAEREKDSFLKVLFVRDHLVLTEFFDLAVRMRLLRERFGLGVLPQSEVDAVQWAAGRFRSAPCGSKD